MKWTCQAKPAALGGATCGHKNTKGTTHGPPRHPRLCCEKCGCTKIASDSRSKDEAHG